MKELILIKIGGSSITEIEKESVARIDVIRRLANEIKKVPPEIKIILGHGGGSFPHVPAKKYKVHEGLINADSLKGTSLTLIAAAQLNKIVANEFCSEGLNPFPFAPSSGVVSKNRRIIEWNLKPLEIALNHGFLPITYGDAVIDSELGVTIVSTEEELRYIASKLKPSKIILGGDIDGVFTANPKIVKDAKLISGIDGKNIDEALKGASGSTKTDVTGGMRTKLEYAYEIAKTYGIECHIVNVDRPGRLYSAIMGDDVIGTVIRA